MWSGSSAHHTSVYLRLDFVLDFVRRCGRLLLLTRRRAHFARMARLSCPRVAGLSVFLLANVRALDSIERAFKSCMSGSMPVASAAFSFASAASMSGTSFRSSAITAEASW